MSKIFWLIFFFSSLCFAESTSLWPEIQNDLLLPFHTDAKAILYTGSAITTAFMLSKNKTAEPIQKDTIQNKPMGKYSDYGNWAGQIYPNLAYMAGMQAYSYFTGDQQSHEFAKLMFKSTLYSSLVTDVFKYTVREERPDKSDRYSFPSAHATRAFAFASTVASLHEWYWGLAAYTMATGVAYSRMNDNRHYIHDVIMGATIGMSYGFSFTEQYHREKFRNDLDSGFTVLPYDDGLMLGWKMRW